MASTLKVVDRRRCIGCLSCRQACARLRGEYSAAISAIDVKTAGGFTGDFIINICRACTDPACMEACKFSALEKRKGGGVIFRRNKCEKCNKCAVACSVSAIKMDNDGYPIICNHCGYCTNYCPHKCIAVKEVL